jgi:hypothetical protein
MSDLSLSRSVSPSSLTSSQRIKPVEQTPSSQEPVKPSLTQSAPTLSAPSKLSERVDSDISGLKESLNEVSHTQLSQRAKETLDTPLLDLEPAKAFNQMINLTESLAGKFPEMYEKSKAMLKVLGDGLELTGECPASQDSIEALKGGLDDFKKRLEAAKGEIAKLFDSEDLVSVPLDKEISSKDIRTLYALRDTLSAQVDTQLDMINEKQAYIERQRLEHPTSKKEVARAKSMWTESALRDVDAQIEKYKGDPAKLKELNQLKDILQQRIQAFRDEKDTTAIVGKKAIGEIMGAKKESWFTFGLKTKGAVAKTLEEFKNGQIRWSSKNLREQDMLEVVLKETYNKLGLKNEAKDLDDRLEHHHVAVLNDQPWNVIDRQVSLQLGGKSFTFGSKIAPAGTLGNVFDSYGGKGVSCATSWEKTHAVNLATTEFTAPNGKVLFKGLRHGIHSAFGIQDSKEREVANHNRAKETLLAAIISDPKLYEKALKGEPIALDLNSISLVTPDAFRGRGTDDDPLKVGKIKKDNEKAMLSEQLKAWDSLDGKEQTLQIKGPNGEMMDIKVTPHINAFNFGVNKGGVGNLSSVIGGWGPSDRANTKALGRLLGENSLKEGPYGGRVGRHIAQLEEQLKTPNLSKSEQLRMNKELRTVRELSDQIRDIWTTEAYKKSSGDPYKMVARLAVLSHIMGDTTAFNCKSGKDRTGELDVEAKFLALQIERTGHVPPYNQELTSEEQTLFRALALEGGNLDMQRLNVSAGGFKLEGVHAITRRLGGDEAKEVHRGLSKHFES